MIFSEISKIFTDIQSTSSYPKSIRTLKQHLLQSKDQTLYAFKQIVLQVFTWQHKSQRLGKIYTLIKKFLQSCNQTTLDLNPSIKSVNEVNTFHKAANELAKQLLLLSCCACNAPSYLIKVRASWIIRK